MSRLKNILLALLVAFIAIQFIQPVHNRSKQVLATDFRKVFAVPDNVEVILQNACYDCHSNNTKYPWYSNIQPMAWMMARHIKNGKDKLNFSDFGSYSSRRQASKLKGIAGQIKDDEMPLSYYTMMHKKAILTKEQKLMIIGWMNETADSISVINNQPYLK